MTMLKPSHLFLFLFFCINNTSFGFSKIYKRNNENPTSLDHNKLTGRWYLYMDTRGEKGKGNTYGDIEIRSNGDLLDTLYEYNPDNEECKSYDIILRPLSSDPSPESAVEFEIIVPSTTFVLGTQKIVYLNDDPADGFVIIHQNTMGEETYLVATRTKNPSDQLTTIETALLKLSLDPKKFTKKPTNFGCET
ncbi:uncharacterized protein LOC128167564 [Crassostrea angulata]|uniref:Lipocalin/cytosolic fatty-acid binding domain-containing protein n=2 Tax=Magallana gigas TaxID=29159 RepID=A0A8W8MTK5_MAGGI|nr:uncharacterized protein LOC105334185 [Crassostrea gigas]XP_052689313.1 uncharacterized protein LOC128167564 [Crassostrea angulata]